MASSNPFDDFRVENGKYIIDKPIQLQSGYEIRGDAVNSPPHYTEGGIEVIDIIETKGFHNNYYLGNVLKYVLRSPYKGKELEDLKKARYYLERYIRLLEVDE